MNTLQNEIVLKDKNKRFDVICKSSVTEDIDISKFLDYP